MPDDKLLHYKLGQRDLLANVCALIRSFGMEDTSRQLAQLLLAHEPDHPHAKWLLEHVASSQERYAKAPKLSIAVAYEIFIGGEHIWWPPTGVPHNITKNKHLTADEIEALKVYIRAGKAEVKEHLSMDNPPSKSEIEIYLEPEYRI